jgi:hypothetical protein
MRRFLMAIAVFVYGLTSLGWVLDIHYCMGKVDAVHLFEKEKSSCGTCGMSAEESEGCCHDEAALVMLIQDQKPPVTLKFNLESPVLYLPPVVALLSKPVLLQRSVFAQPANAPPGFSNPLFLRNRVFRI